MSILKICKGTGKAVKYKGCGNPLEYAERENIKLYFAKHGLGTKGCRCYSTWLIESEEGQELIIKNSKKMYVTQKIKPMSKKRKKENERS